MSTALILVSSVTIEVARRKLKQSFSEAYSRYLLLTALLGLGFSRFAVDCLAAIGAQGIYVASHPHSSFFYLLTGAHAVHLARWIAGADVFVAAFAADN